ncbi:hypothetical protein [Halovivax cerinus]|uniref:Uncharacterized protein n=1 Tax=Halovivax cerinus TaxID=1487865 RepID=A0ABD5NLY6_9EURY|nr:hypothetical protein [Halovivax cerinus]
MNQLRTAPAWTQRVLLVGVVAYFATWIGSIALESSLLGLASAALFGFIAAGIGVVVITEASEGETILLIGGAGLALGGLAELVWVAGLLAGVVITVASQVASLLVFGGLLAYVYAVWIAG